MCKDIFNTLGEILQPINRNTCINCFTEEYTILYIHISTKKLCDSCYIKEKIKNNDKIDVKLLKPC